jgi:hypothetical protein
LIYKRWTAWHSGSIVYTYTPHTDSPQTEYEHAGQCEDVWPTDIILRPTDIWHIFTAGCLLLFEHTFIRF